MSGYKPLKASDISPEMHLQMNTPLSEVLDNTANMKLYHHLLYWVIERMVIYKRRCIGDVPPWTRDIILQNNFFCTPFRELDKTTAYLRREIRDPIDCAADPDVAENVLFAVVAFRWFNLPATGEFLAGRNPYTRNFFTSWDFDKAVEILGKRAEDGTKLFTSGYIIKLENNKPKYLSVCEQLQKWWDHRFEHYEYISECERMEDAHKYIAAIKHLGKFMAYEIVCDLIYTHVLEHAEDRNTWCNPGPGCVRGILRLKRVDFSNFQRNSINVGGSTILDDCRYLLGRMREDIPKVLAGDMVIFPPHGIGYGRDEAYSPHMGVSDMIGTDLTPYDGRFVEGCMCEFDKYQRLIRQDGRSKRRYVPGHYRDEWERLLSLSYGG